MPKKKKYTTRDIAQKCQVSQSTVSMILSGREDIHFKTRVTYILHRIYPKGQGFREAYPFFYKHVWAYIFLPVYRLARRGNIKSLFREAMLALKTR